MKMSFVIKVAVVGLAIGSLTACNRAGNKSMGQQAYDSGAQSYGYNDASADAQGFHVNSMKAPSNQVYYFDFDQSTVRQQDTQAMGIQANYLASHAAARVRLEGNTDNRGSREYNVALGWRRAQTIARYLEQQGVRPEQIQTISYGKERPAAPGDDEHAWALNRRVNLVYKAY